MQNNFVLSPDEIRGLEDMGKIPGGSYYASRWVSGRG